MKRITVRRMLNKRLADAKLFLKNEPFITDCDIAYGSYDEDATNQAIINAQTDADQLEFLKKCLDNREVIEKIIFEQKLEANNSTEEEIEE